MSDFYVRADGAATKANATGKVGEAAGSSAAASETATSMSMATFNAATFAAGDTVWFSSQGGDFTTGMIPPTASVTYRAITGETPKVIVATGHGIVIQVGKNSITLNGLWGETQQSGVNAGLLIQGAVSGVTLTDVHVKGPAFGMLALAATTNLSGSVTVEGAPTTGGVRLYNAAHTGVNLTVTNSGGYGLRLEGAGGAITGAITLNSTSTGTNTVTGVTCATQGALTLTPNINAAAAAPLDIVGCTKLTISGGTFTGCGTTRILTTASTDILFDGMTYLDAGNTPIAVSIAGCSGVCIDNCVIDNSASGAVSLSGVANGRVRGCRFVNGGGDAVYLSAGATGNVIELNEIAYNGNKASTSDGDGITSHDNDSGTIIRYNNIHHNTASGIANIGTSSGEIYSNAIWENGGDWTGEGGLDQVRGDVYIHTTGGPGWTLRNNRIGGGYPLAIRTGAASPVDSDYNAITTGTDGVASQDDGATVLDWAAYSLIETHSVNAEAITAAQMITAAVTDDVANIIAGRTVAGVTGTATVTLVRGGTRHPDGDGYAISNPSEVHYGEGA